MDYTSKTDPNEKNEWQTPPEVFQYANREFDFKIDLFASKKNALCPRFYTKEQNALMMGWDASSWGNPPYSSGNLPDLSNHLVENARCLISAVFLVPAVPAEGWFGRMLSVCSEVRYISPGRLSFLRPDGTKGTGNKGGSAFVIFRPGYDRRHLSIMENYVSRAKVFEIGDAILKGNPIP